MSETPVPNCTSWLGHKFEARYSKGASTSPGMKISSGLYALAAAASSTARWPHDLPYRRYL